MWNCFRKPTHPEEPDVVPALPPLGQVGHDLPHHTTEFVAVTGEPGGNCHLRMLRMLGVQARERGLGGVEVARPLRRARGYRAGNEEPA